MRRLMMDDFWVFFIVFVMLTLIGILAARDAKKRGEHFDEMQRMIRGKAYTAGFFTVTCLCLILVFAEDGGVLDMLHMTPSFATFAALMAGYVVVGVYNVWHGAYFAINGDNKMLLFINALAGIFLLAELILSLAMGTFLESGMLEFGNEAGDIVLGIGMAAVPVTYLLRRRFRDNDELDHGDHDPES